MSEKLTKKQSELLDYIKIFNNEHGYSPSYREIMAAREYKSVSTVAVHVDNLVRLGLLKKVKNQARTLEPVQVESSPETAAVSEADHIDWLKGKIRKCQEDPSRSDELDILNAALALLDPPKGQAHS